jgi:hypothetical protein
LVQKSISISQFHLNAWCIFLDRTFEQTQLLIMLSFIQFAHITHRNCYIVTRSLRVTNTCYSLHVRFSRLRLLCPSLLIGITRYFKMHDVIAERARICVRVCLCVYEVAHLHLMALMNSPVPLTWWVPTHVWEKGWKRLLISTEGQLIIAGHSTPALLLQLGVIKFPFNFTQRVKTAVRCVSRCDGVAVECDLFNLSKPSIPILRCSIKKHFFYTVHVCISCKFSQ